MRNRAGLCGVLLIAFIFGGCGKKSENSLVPLLGLEWFASVDDVKGKVESLSLIQERAKDAENSGNQLYIDYADAELMDVKCDITFDFSDDGLIGLNYHDIEKTKNFREWNESLQQIYGVPTEQGNGMASWYKNPVGKDTALYLFNLQEGVQISFYATGDSPDKNYENKKKQIHTPEIRTPIVPITEEESAETPVSTSVTSDVSAANTEEVYNYGDLNVVGTDAVGNLVVVVTDTVGDFVTDKVGETVTTIVPVDITATTVSGEVSGTTTQTTVVEKEAEPPKEDKGKSFLINGLKFYGSPDAERRKMSGYTQLYEYRTEEAGQPWELIMEYENVPYLGKKCDGVLCFTSIGLVGINYFDSDTGNYNYWVKQLTEIYGSPDETQYDYTAWNSSPVGEGTMIYIFALEDGIQISFFADDTDSELA